MLREARVGVQAATAPDSAHKQGVVERVVKPANLILDRRGKLWVTESGPAQFYLGHAGGAPNLTRCSELIRHVVHHRLAS